MRWPWWRRSYVCVRQSSAWTLRGDRGWGGGEVGFLNMEAPLPYGILDGSDAENWERVGWMLDVDSSAIDAVCRRWCCWQRWWRSKLCGSVISSTVWKGRWSDEWRWPCGKGFTCQDYSWIVWTVVACFFFFFGFWVLCLTCACMKNDEDLVVTIYALFSTKEISEKFMR